MPEHHDTPPQRPVLTLLPVEAGAPDPACDADDGGVAGDDPLARGRLVAGDVAALLSGATPAEMGADLLVLPLALSVSMQRHGADVRELIAALRLLRAAVLAVAGFDAVTEPVPLGSGDPTAAALHFGRYLHDLLVRVASTSGCHPAAVAEAVVAHLQAA